MEKDVSRTRSEDRVAMHQMEEQASSEITWVCSPTSREPLSALAEGFRWVTRTQGLFLVDESTIKTLYLSWSKKKMTL